MGIYLSDHEEHTILNSIVRELEIEMKQLITKIEKLDKFFHTKYYFFLSNKQRRLIDKQYKAMNNYLKSLEERIKDLKRRTDESKN